MIIVRPVCALRSHKKSRMTADGCRWEASPDTPSLKMVHPAPTSQYALRTKAVSQCAGVTSNESPYWPHTSKHQSLRVNVYYDSHAAFYLQ